MAIKLEQDAERVLDENHAEGLFVREVFTQGHSPLATGGNDLFQKVFEVGIQHRDVERAVIAGTGSATAILNR